MLVGAGGKQLWRDAGPLRGEELLKALSGLRPPPGKRPRLPRQRALGHFLGLGTLAPDLLFPCDDGVLVAMRKLRGRELVLCFWTSWSEPSIEELRRLAPVGGLACRDETREHEHPVVLCVNDGEAPERAAEALKRHRLDLTLVPDPKRVLAQRYGVTCWPTVVRVDRQGRIAGVRFGLEHDWPGAAASPARGS